MRILHTSDWHIGKRIAGRERLEEQRAILSEIADLCESERIELVLIAGDVFDTFLPSAEAEDLFYAAVKKIAAGKRAVVAISGNHDDNVRLTAATALSEEQGIYIFGNSGRVPRLSAAGSIRAADAGKSHILFENEKGERTFVHALPYPNEARLKETKNADESYFDKMRRWISEGERCNAQGDPSVFLAHIFVAGGKVSDSEREIDLGGARAVPLELLPRCDYAALGHLHIQIPISPFITPPSCHHHFQTRVPLKTASTSPSSAAKTIPDSQIHFLSFLTQHAPFFTHRFWENSLYSQVNLPIGDNRTGNDVLLAAAPTPIPIDNPKIFT